MMFPKQSPVEELTAEMVQQYCTLINWMLDVQLTVGQKAKVKQILSGYFQRQDSKKIAEVHSFLKEYAELAEMTAEKRRDTCVKNIPHMLQELDTGIAKGDEEMRWLKQTFYGEHPILLTSNPPLTREVAATWLELDQFVRTNRAKQIARQNRKVVFPPTPPVARRREILLTRWKAMPEKERYRFYRLPGEFVQLKALWKTLPDKKKNEMLDQLVYGNAFLLNESS